MANFTSKGPLAISDLSVVDSDWARIRLPRLRYFGFTTALTQLRGDCRQQFLDPGDLFLGDDEYVIADLEITDCAAFVIDDEVGTCADPV